MRGDFRRKFKDKGIIVGIRAERPTPELMLIQFWFGFHRRYTNNDTLPEWGILASYLGSQSLIALTANLRARYRAKRHIYTNPNANLNANPNANP